MQNSRPLIVAILLLIAARAMCLLHPMPGFPPYIQPPMDVYAVQDFSSALWGMRRLGADLGFVQMLQYIVTPEQEVARLNDFNGAQKNTGLPDETFAYTLRIVELDPYFHFAYLLGAGLLAFSNAQDYGRAIELLHRGMQNDPSYWKFRIYAAAIGYKSAEDTPQVIRYLEEAYLEPDCPVMLQNILANLQIKVGNYSRAVDILEHIVETSRDEYYVEKSRSKIFELEEKFAHH